MFNKKLLSERDICTKYISPAIEKAGWNKHIHYLEEVNITAGKILVKGSLTTRAKNKRADYILYYKDNPVAIIEAKDNNHAMGAGMQQGLEYARMLDIPCIFSSNGDGFIFHDKTAQDENIEVEIGLDEFPSPEAIWLKYKTFKGLDTPITEKVALQKYYSDGSGRKPRYYQQIAINRTVQAIAKGNNRILLIMATGTGKTYTAFQIAYILWKASVKKRILFLADRTALIDQTRKGDFKHFKDKMTVVEHRQVDKSYEIYLALYQGLSGNEDDKNIYKQFSPEFFDLIIVDECHRGSAKDDSAWREILAYFSNATQIGLTATPKETKETSNIEYFKDPVYTYSLKQGIDDGFLAPYKVLKMQFGMNSGAEQWRPEKDKLDKQGNLIEDRVYNLKDFDRNLVIEERTRKVAKRISDFLKATNRFDKTIIFCEDIEHAERMRSEIVNQNPDLCRANDKYVVRITGDNDEGKRELDNFINPEETYPVIATTSELMTTGVDAQTCKLIVLDANIGSMTKFKQIIGRGTRINEEFGKRFFTIMDFRSATELFADKNFDGEPIRIKEINEETDFEEIVAEENDLEAPISSEYDAEETVALENAVNETKETYKTKDFFSATPNKRTKVFVNGVEVTLLVEREMYFDNDGKPITKSLKDYTKDIIQARYNSLDEFLNKWNATDRKDAIIAELEEQGIFIEHLKEAVNKDFDLFDLICHIAFEQPPLSRKDRVESVKKRNYFTKYGEQARKILETLLEKYGEEGIENLENIDILKVQPLSQFGSAYEIITTFGGKSKYLQAIKELENEIYKTA
ncbi:EcoEI R domain protein [Emticicia oligotrophica DSM 17448]|uniref:EcoEI R domain protein n=1 Tax=Emticicia oligotrophica (strain DSM 17448 / CIP 109782 / MTCC 6937 / GPTSA100-15) TaxID=929562 RepID=A0ABM5MZP2_EMTOG|nr:DEAD/DEAH box helicase family protein [Emticicia oligotrophica]AFK02673.1 EcoEI R domain protein [Emticicia oligotrophica DSM 17448]